MRFEAKVGADGEILIPEGVRARLSLEPDAAVIVEIPNAALDTQNCEPDWEKLDELVARLRGPMMADLLADGYSSFDHYLDDVRGR